MVDEKEKSTCTGCWACVGICPKGCISMESDEQGFLYPVIERDKCVRCGECDRVCSLAAQKANQKNTPKAFAAFARDEQVQKNSSSGGIFTLLCRAVLAEGGIVSGVAMKQDMRKAEHIFVENDSEIAALRGAKYLQSELPGCFPQIKGLLGDGRTVLFSGSPCQVSGLKAYLGKEYENLLCVDMICHGVPSPMIWAKYCEETEKKASGKISSVNFRCKKYTWEKLRDKDKNIYMPKKQDPYMRLFLADYSLRPSCYACLHKGISRKSDITIADFWGVNRIVPGFSNGAGTSLIMAHTEKGEQYLQKISDSTVMQEADPIAAVQKNGAAVNSAQRPQRQAEFWNELKNRSIGQLADEFVPIDTKEKLKSVLTHSSGYGLLKKGKNTNMEDGILFVIDKETHP